MQYVIPVLKNVMYSYVTKYLTELKKNKKNNKKLSICCSDGAASLAALSHILLSVVSAISRHIRDHL